MFPYDGVQSSTPMDNSEPSKVSRNIPVVIAESSASRWGRLKRGLSKEPEFMLVHCSSEADEVFSCCRKLSPCILVTDQTLLEKVDPVEFARLNDFGRSVCVVVRVQTENAETLESFLRMGCMGLVHERSSLAILKRAIRAVAAGELWASRRLISAIVQELLSADSPQKLTRRETEILQLIARGHTNKQISNELFISRETVRWHLRTLYAKIGVHDRLSAACYAANMNKPRSKPMLRPTG